MNSIQQAIKTLQKVYNYAFLTDSQTDELDWVIELLTKLPPTIWKEDIDKLQRYVVLWNWELLESDAWLLIRYDDLKKLLLQ